MNIIKRDGNKALFDSNNIISAISRAMKSCGVDDVDTAESIAGEIERYYKVMRETPTVGSIERKVFYYLVEEGYPEVAKSYEEFRVIQEYKRKTNTIDDSIVGLIQRTSKELLNENSNKNGVLANTQRDLIAGEVSKDYLKRKILPTNLTQAVELGWLWYHDSDYAIQPIFNCSLPNLEDMLMNGTFINEKQINSPTSFPTACLIATQIALQISNSQYGGQSFTSKHLAPFLRRSYEKYFELVDKEVYEYAEEVAHRLMMKDLKDGVQSFRYQLSSMTGCSGQSPFLTLLLEVEEGSEYEHEQVLIVEEFLKQRIDGMQNRKGQSISEAFPKYIYVLDEHNCLNGGKYDYLTKLSIDCNIKRMAPDYLSGKLMRERHGAVFPPMGCRSFVSEYINEDGNKQWYGRFNQGVVTLNLPNIALSSNGDMAQFWKLLDERLDLCYEALMIRHNLLKGTISDVSPIHWQAGAIARLKPGETIDKYLYGNYSSISLGFIGCYEMCKVLLGVSHTTSEGKIFTEKVLNHLKEKTELWRARTNIGFSLYATPSESLAGRFCEKDVKTFGVIEDVTDKGYYVNGFHVDPREEIDLFSKFTFEAPFHQISSGGTITYAEIPNMNHNKQVLEQVLKFGYENVQYFELNSRLDVCYTCGFEGEMDVDRDNALWSCPYCGNDDHREMQVLRRT